MDIKALTEFNKFTLAVAIGSLAYMFGQMLPPTSELNRWWSYLAFFFLVVSLIAGVLIFAAATAAENALAAKDTSRQSSCHSFIHITGIIHAGSLVFALIIQCFLSLDKFEIKPSVNNKNMNCKSQILEIKVISEKNNNASQQQTLDCEINSSNIPSSDKGS